LRAGQIFHILVVDDDRAGAQLMRRVMKNLRARYELHFVWDGVEALDFLHRRGAHSEAPRPNLVLLDINMPRLGGLETLSAIKSDPELYVIPVIMLSTSNSSDDVQECYKARANCFVQKPIDLERSMKLLQAIETFWIDFALLPPIEKPGRTSRSPMGTNSQDHGLQTGPSIAAESAEARSQAMSAITSHATETTCEEHDRLLEEFGLAVRELLTLHQQQFLAIAEADSECSRFDLLIHMANENKQLTKYAYLRHVEAHGCSKT
jgi:CheY-like chemotaxis protein